MGRRSGNISSNSASDAEELADIESQFAVANSPEAKVPSEDNEIADVAPEVGVQTEGDVSATVSSRRRRSSMSDDEEVSEEVLDREAEIERVARELAANPNLREAVGADGEIYMPPNIHEIAAAQAAGHDYEPDADEETAENTVDGVSEDLLVDPSEEGVEAPEQNPDTLEFEKIEGLDPLHEEILSLLMAPRIEMHEQSLRELADLKDDASRLEGEKAHLEELNKAQMEAAARGGQPGGIGAALGNVINGVAHGVAAATRGFKSPEGVLKRDAIAVQNQISNKRSFRSRVIDRQYGTLVDSVDGMYRTAREYDASVKDFNAKFEASDKGSSYLRGLQHIADKKGVEVSDIQARILDRNDNDTIISKLRNRQSTLLSDPEFAGDISKLNGMAADMTLQADRITGTMSTLKGNGAKLPELDKLSEKLGEGLKLEAPVLQQGDEENNEKLKKAIEDIQKKLKEFIDDLIASFTGERKEPAAP